MTTATHAQETLDRSAGSVWGAFIADALAMPVHWYYDREALRRDYGRVTDFLPPRNPHPDSILWRSQHVPEGPAAEILHDQARYWGRRGVHYHQFLQSGENTLNFQLCLELLQSLETCGAYDADDYLNRYLRFMQTPGSHRDTYVEEYHRHFFNQLARGRQLRQCGIDDIHIGGLSAVPLLTAWHASDSALARKVVREHVALTHRARNLLHAADTFQRVLAEVIAGGDLRDTIAGQATDWFSTRKAERWLKEPDEVVVGIRLSPACYIDDAFPASLYLAWKYADDIEGGLVANTNLGGDNCHRGIVVGALLGAALGLEAIPNRWREGLKCGGQLQGFNAHVDLPAT